MLFIYGTLGLGGIETFFVRMAKERFTNGLSTKILLQYPEKSDNQLLNEMQKYAEVVSVKEIMLNIPKITASFPLAIPLKKNKVLNLLDGVKQIHVSDGMDGLLAYKLIQLINYNIPITVGFYHHIKFAWGGKDVSYYEKTNRKFVLNYLPKKSLLTFSKDVIDYYKNNQMQVNLTDANTFRIGTVDEKSITMTGILSEPLKICSIGRLVDLKTYNFYMIGIIASLSKKGIKIEFDIYGDGPLKKEIIKEIEFYNMQEHIRIKGSFAYSEFDNIVSLYDMFIGTGTAIIQASSMGVCSIIGIEDTEEPKSYGYFCDFYNRQYTIKGLDVELLDIEDMILNFINFSESERKSLQLKHLKCIKPFTNTVCLNNFLGLNNNKMPDKPFEYSIYRYFVSRLFDKFLIKVNKNHHWNTRHSKIKES